MRQTNPAAAHGRTRIAARQRGAAALVVTMVLFFAMLLIAAYTNRGLLFEQRASVNQYRATQAFEAAEAGLEWALAQLNNPAAVGADCQAAGDAGGQPLRERLLQYTAADRRHTPRTWNNAGVAVVLQPACVRTPDGWLCSCPADGFPLLPPDTVPAAAPQPAFSVQLAPGPRADLLRLSATGCSQLAGACRPGTAGDAADATARVQVELALLPALARPPRAPLTVKDGVNTGMAALGLFNTDAATGVVLHAGGSADLAAARLATAPGADPLLAIVQGDAPLHARTADAFFATFFGLDKATWRGQPGVRRLACGSGCATTLSAETAAGHRLLWIDGDLALDGPLTLGSADRPVLIVASGAVRLRGALTVHGLVYAGSLNWDDTPGTGAAAVHGALISEAGYSGNGAPDLTYDSAVLERLRSASGSFARVPGSWKDF